MVLDDIGVKSVAICIGGSMAGMHVFEWAFFGQDYIKAIVPVSAPAKSSAWSMSWTEAQRQSIFTDPKYMDGYYSLDSPPLQGMVGARMIGLLTYRTRVSYERRFGRDIMEKPSQESESPCVSSAADVHRHAHNAGHRHMKEYPSSFTSAICLGLQTPGHSPTTNGNTTPNGDARASNVTISSPVAPVYAAHSYLRYQADKFNERFDANCYIALSRKMDGHDVSRGRGEYESVVRSIQQPTLIVAVESDNLFPFYELEALGKLLPNSELAPIKSEEGHDGFLLEFDQVNDAIVAFMQKYEHIREILRQEGVPVPEKTGPRGTMFASW